ncbi:SET domain-containing protein [Sphingomonas psychrotolerans]|uniref:SET domain-containing protein-lysine N-methyltransferase n=1 Tax=Sphingomonas psychrotolerans TaxID=1327635 RepID=A0A2K8MS00_9SPHN|nr:SET domain-containing protein-lysine N-methyltransferase [Sphingomonas psychrotolerans]ATY34261.1 SET domain-containing protein-lysine N-methyltransferase [Sphingomonas psychrotolerans]
MGLDIWFVLAIGLSFAGYAVYLLGLRHQTVRPNRASWLIWAAATSLEALTYAAVNPGAPQGWVFALSAIACVAVTISIWRRSSWAPPSPTETFCIATCLTALVLWLVFREAFWAHMLVVAAVPVSFWPTWASAWADRSRERSPAWGLWTFGDLATLLIAVRGAELGLAELGYILVELLCHASVWFLIGLTTINPLRAFGVRRGGLRIFERYRASNNLFRVGDNHLGKAVFAAAPFAEGAILLEFTGRRLPAHQLPSLMQGRSDRFVQVTPDHYMGPSGQLDDLVNHSCAPNAGLRFTDEGVFLVAVRAIAAGEEISWDYSTTLRESNWHMLCKCKAPECRRVIGNFESLDAERQEWFRARNLVAPYLRRRDDVGGKRAAG